MTRKEKRLLAAVLCMCTTVSMLNVRSASAESQEKMTGFELEAVIVQGSRYYDKFGNRLTEQSYYRTGGDVTVIDRQEIEEKNYRSVEEAIKRVPGDEPG